MMEDQPQKQEQEDKTNKLVCINDKKEDVVANRTLSVDDYAISLEQACQEAASVAFMGSWTTCATAPPTYDTDEKNSQCDTTMMITTSSTTMVNAIQVTAVHAAGKIVSTADVGARLPSTIPEPTLHSTSTTITAPTTLFRATSSSSSSVASTAVTAIDFLCGSVSPSSLRIYSPHQQHPLTAPATVVANPYRRQQQQQEQHEQPSLPNHVETPPRSAAALSVAGTTPRWSSPVVNPYCSKQPSASTQMPLSDGSTSTLGDTTEAVTSTMAPFDYSPSIPIIADPSSRWRGVPCQPPDCTTVAVLASSRNRTTSDIQPSPMTILHNPYKIKSTPPTTTTTTVVAMTQQQATTPEVTDLTVDSPDAIATMSATNGKVNYLASTNAFVMPASSTAMTHIPLKLITTNAAATQKNPASNTSASTGRIQNPYLKKTITTVTSSGTQCTDTGKFVGGAWMSRNKAVTAAAASNHGKVKKKATRILRPEEQQRLDGVLPNKLNPFERFFAALLRSPPSEFAASASSLFAESSHSNINSTNNKMDLWGTICQRLGLTVPTEPIKAVYDDKNLHFAVRAALVLEEARHAIAQPLADRWKLGGKKQSSSSSSSRQMTVSARLEEKTNSLGHSRVMFFKRSPFTKEELFHLRPGTLFECLPRDGARVLPNVALGVVVSGNRESMEKNRKFTLMFFHEIHDPNDSQRNPLVEGTDWIVSPLASLVTELRAYEAMQTYASSVSFLPTLLGGKSSTHIRFDSVKSERLDHDNGDNSAFGGSMVAPFTKAITDFFASDSTATTMDSKNIDNAMFQVAPLNATQQKAAATFLKSEQNTITLVQGPPGTGKTTLLVSIICQYLKMSSEGGNRRRLMVCAPTNKAITVLAVRFMQAVNRDTFHMNALMVGDGEKLLHEEYASKSLHRSNDAQLRSIFLYTWMQSVMEDYRKIRNNFMPGSGLHWPKDLLYRVASRLEHRLQSLPFLNPQTASKAADVTARLKRYQHVLGSEPDIVDTIKDILNELRAIPTDQVYGQLMASADVIFCTLVSAGGKVFKTTKGINDLIVDEAAAATEPELCIPFHLRPTRLLAVGDPLQLPATVMSRRACELGLTKSLHERLMFDCDYKHIMLDVQYRMNPAISSFPSFRFYQSKIANGTNVSCPQYARGAPLLDRLPYIFLQVSGIEEQVFPGGSHRNNAEARVVVDLVLQLRSLSSGSGGGGNNDANTNNNNNNTNGHWDSVDRIRIITFYQAQVNLIKQYLREKNISDKIVATVDSSQGCEADVVLVSFVRSMKKGGNYNDNNHNSINGAVKKLSRHDAGFLTDDRRMNVALTRAKYQLICIGNVRHLGRLEGAETIQLLAVDAEKREGVVRPYPSEQQQQQQQQHHHCHQLQHQNQTTPSNDQPQLDQFYERLTIPPRKRRKF